MNNLVTSIECTYYVVTHFYLISKVSSKQKPLWVKLFWSTFTSSAQALAATILEVYSYAFTPSGHLISIESSVCDLLCFGGSLVVAPHYGWVTFHCMFMAQFPCPFISLPSWSIIFFWSVENAVKFSSFISNITILCNTLEIHPRCGMWHYQWFSSCMVEYILCFVIKAFLKQRTKIMLGKEYGSINLLVTVSISTCQHNAVDNI